MPVTKRSGQQHDGHYKGVQCVDRAYEYRERNLARDNEIDCGDEQAEIDRGLDESAQVEVLDADNAENCGKADRNGVTLVRRLFAQVQ